MIDDDFHLYDTNLPIITTQSELNNYCNTTIYLAMRALGSSLDKESASPSLVPHTACTGTSL